MRRRKTKIISWIIGFCLVTLIIGANSNQESRDSEQSAQQESSLSASKAEANDNSGDKNTENAKENQSEANAGAVKTETSAEKQTRMETYQVVSVVDGDTIKVNYQGQITSVRLIGVNTPETVDPRKSVECFGVEASNFLKNQLDGKTVTLVADPTQTNRDKYNRLLRYVYLDGQDMGLKIINDGYGYEYTYNVPYQKQSEYKAAQTSASSGERGIWARNACSGSSSQNSSTAPATSNAPANNTGNCNIKGNINSKGEKIYHLPGQRYYNNTKIDTGKGERWFCSEQEALNAGWRAAKV